MNNNNYKPPTNSNNQTDDGKVQKSRTGQQPPVHHSKSPAEVKAIASKTTPAIKDNKDNISLSKKFKLLGKSSKSDKKRVLIDQPSHFVTIMESPLGRDPAHLICPHCKAEIATKIEDFPSTRTWIISGVLCLFWCWFGCCLIPFCTSSLKDVRHTCPNCVAYLGTFRA